MRPGRGAPPPPGRNAVFPSPGRFYRGGPAENVLPEPPAEPRQPRPALLCSDCGEGVFSGDGYYRIDGLCYCEECAERRFRRLAE